MCTVSMVTDVFMRRYPNPIGITPTDYTWLKELIRKAEEYDKLNKQPDCPDPIKADWLTKAREAQKMQDAEAYKWVPSTTITLSSEFNHRTPYG